VQQKVVALGGGHGLAATLTSLRKITPLITAIVTVADNGGSSGRLRAEFPILPPGDLRMALVALCSDDEWGREWARIMHHRFTGDGSLQGHAVASLLKVVGRVLPMASQPLDIEATFQEGGRFTIVRGQAEVATARGKLESLRIIPHDPPSRDEALSAISQADWITMGPGSWISSVLPHLLVPSQRKAIVEAKAKRIVVLNLDAVPELSGNEYAGYTPEEHLNLIRQYAQDFRANYVIADSSVVRDSYSLEREVRAMGGQLLIADLRKSVGSVHHDVEKLTSVFGHIMSNSLIG
jgi:2-phospho-L-lactate transferase/gluconeogenesis factor (CofD/UPF0052 family)